MLKISLKTILIENVHGITINNGVLVIFQADMSEFCHLKKAFYITQ